jgi:hypothetical protein
LITAGLSPERDDDGRDPFDVFVDASVGAGHGLPRTTSMPSMQGQRGHGRWWTPTPTPSALVLTLIVMVMLLLPLVHVVSDGLSVGKHSMRFLR